MKKLLFAISIFAQIQCLAEVDRIQSLRFDRSQVKAIYLAPGLGSIVLFPCALIEAFVGRSEDLKVQISPNDKKTLFLNLKLNSSLPTNLIARCESEKNVYVFDVIPSHVKHQDVVEIRSSFGGPSVKHSNYTEIAKAHPSINKLVIESPTLISKGVSK